MNAIDIYMLVVIATAGGEIFDHFVFRKKTGRYDLAAIVFWPFVVVSIVAIAVWLGVRNLNKIVGESWFKKQ